MRITRFRPALARTVAARMGSAGALAATASLLTIRDALAHTGEDVPLSHVILEVGQWTLGAAAVVGALVGLLWLRARLRGGR